MMDNSTDKVGSAENIDSSITDSWSVLFDNNQLNHLTIRSYWASIVPRIYGHKRNCNCLRVTFDEEKARMLLFFPLEKFITRSDDPRQIFESLKETDKKPGLCLKVFKNGDPVYSCRDCGLDASCVLCLECFKQR